MAKFKVVRNVRLFTSYSIDSNLQDEIAGQDGVRKWTYCKFDGRSSGNIDNKDSKQTKVVIEKSVGIFRSHCESKEKAMFSRRLKSIIILNCPVSCVSFTLKFGLTIVSYILNLFISKIIMRYSKTNTIWFISKSSENSWSLGVGCVRLLPSALRREIVSCTQHIRTSNFHYFPQYHVWICLPPNTHLNLIPLWEWTCMSLRILYQAELKRTCCCQFAGKYVRLQKEEVEALACL